MRKWLLAMTAFLALLVLGGVALASQDYSPATNGCQPEAKVVVDQPVCDNSRAVTGRVTGTACGDAAVTIRQTYTCGWYTNNRLVGTGHTTADGAFAVPLSDTLSSCSYSCRPCIAVIEVKVECPCGPLQVEAGVLGPSRFPIPAIIPVPQAGQTTLLGQWDPRGAGATVTVADQQGHVLGTGLIQPDGSFVIYLSRPLQSGERITVIGACGWDTLMMVVIGPIPIPEAGTWLLLGAGLAGVAGYVGLRWRARK